MKTCIMMIAGCFEREYWREWAKWHHDICGFDEVFILTNNWTLDNPLPEYVTTERFDGVKAQLQGYNNFAIRHIKDYDWVMVMDGDEFLYIPEGKRVSDYFSEAEGLNFHQVSFQWMMFGDGGEGVPENGSVVRRFQRASGVFKMEVKSAISFKWCREHNVFPIWVNPHFACVGFHWLPSLHYPLMVGMIGPTVKQIEGTPVDKDKPYIAHYFTKTRAEWAERRGLPRPDNNQLRDPKEFDEENHNEIEWPYMAMRLG